jgi:hypothetical protein
MALFRNFGVNHAKDVTGLAESLVRRTRVRLRAIPPISLNLQKIAHFWIGNLSVPLMKPWMDTYSYHWHQYRSITGVSDYFFASPNGSRKNNFAILGVETPARQGAKTQEYLDIPGIRTSSRTGFIAVQNRKLFLSEPRAMTV